MNDQRHISSIRAVNTGLACNIALAFGKTITGILGHSQALLADGINSMSDVAYYVVIRVFMGLARKPPDREHPYGHSQLESISAMVVGAFVLTTAIAIFWDAINGFYDLAMRRAEQSPIAWMALWVALVTVILKLVLTAYTKRVGRATLNPAILALASDHRNDVISASGAAVGITLSLAGLPWVDPLAGALVAIVVFRTGLEIIRQSSSDLMDTVPGHALHKQIHGLLNGDSGIRAVEEIHAHRFGPYLVVNVTIGIDGALTVQEGDAIASRAERIMYDTVPFLMKAYVHYHPTGSVVQAARDPTPGVFPHLAADPDAS